MENKKDMLNVKAGYYIGSKRNHEKIGKFRVAAEIADVDAEDIDIGVDGNDVCVEDYIEILYKEKSDFDGSVTIIGISDLFEIIGRDDDIPEYDIILTRKSNGVMDIKAKRAEPIYPDNEANLLDDDVFETLMSICIPKQNSNVDPERLNATYNINATNKFSPDKFDVKDKGAVFVLIKKIGICPDFSVASRYKSDEIRKNIDTFSLKVDHVNINVVFNSPELIIKSEFFELTFVKLTTIEWQ